MTREQKKKWKNEVVEFLKKEKNGVLPCDMYKHFGIAENVAYSRLRRMSKENLISSISFKEKVIGGTGVWGCGIKPRTMKRRLFYHPDNRKEAVMAIEKRGGEIDGSDVRIKTSVAS